MIIENSTNTVPSALYDENYYLNLAGGGSLYANTQGAEIDPRAGRLLDFVRFGPDTRVLDIGCGRGELLKALCKSGVDLAVGIDYSDVSMRLATKILSDEIKKGRCSIQKADGTRLPYPDQSFDYVTLADVVEHLYPRQLAECLLECKRVLKGSGRILIHTFPNKLCWDIGYPIVRCATNFLRRNSQEKLPANPRTEYDPILHVNEQTPWALRRALASAGFRDSQVWLEFSHLSPYLNFLARGGSRKREFAFKLVSLPPFRNLFFNDIYAIAGK